MSRYYQSRRPTPVTEVRNNTRKNLSHQNLAFSPSLVISGSTLPSIHDRLMTDENPATTVETYASSRALAVVCTLALVATAHTYAPRHEAESAVTVEMQETTTEID